MPPERFGPYRALGVLGRGGMGVVYRARHEESGREVAVKTLKVAGGAALEEMRREVLALARIRHPGIVAVVEQGVEGETPWYAMELVPGPTLRAVTQGLWESSDALPPPRGELHDTSTLALVPRSGAGDDAGRAPEPRDDDGFRPPVAAGKLAEAIAVAAGICEPLAYLHGEGLVHRDLKPENVIVAPDRGPVLLDLGLARRFHAAGGRDVLEVAPIAGTAAYMAPEQCKGEPADARADLYALGCILHELLTGRPPFGTGSAATLVHHHVATPPPAPSEWAAGVPGELDELVALLLAKEPARRIGHAGAVARVLRQLGAPPPDPAAPRARPYLYLPPLAGRTRELDAVAAAVGAAIERRGALLLLEGEAGSGKTRLAREAAGLAQHRGMVVVAEACDPDGAGTPGAPLSSAASLLRHVRARVLREPRAVRFLGDDSALLAAHAPLLADLPGIGACDVAADDVRRRLVLALSRVARDLAGDRPLLWILDDVAHADPVTAEALVALVEEGLDGLPLLLLGTRRPSDAELLPGGCRIVVGRLADAPLEEMASGMLAAPAPPALAAALARHTEGNPLFVVEYLRAAIDAGILVLDGAGRWRLQASADPTLRDLQLPTSLRGLLEARLAALAGDDASVVEMAALSGPELDLRLLAAAGIPEDRAHLALHELTRASILSADGGTVRFAHGKLREVALARLPPGTRRALHARLAGAIETLPEEERRPRLLPLARHLEGAGEDSRAAVAYVAAGTLADAALHWEQADEAFAGARRCSGRDDTLPALLPALLSWGSRVLPSLGRPDDALAVLDEAAELARRRGNLAAAADARISSASVLRTMGRLESASALLAELLAPLRQADEPGLLARALATLSSVDLQRGQTVRAAELALEARQLAPRISDPAMRALLAQEEGLVRFVESRYEEAAQALQEARTLARASRSALLERRCLVNLANVRYRQGLLDEAARDYEESRRLAVESGDRQMEALALANLGQLEGELGRPAQAEQHHRRALALHRRMKARPMEAMVLTNLALLMLQEGRPEAALPLFAESIAISREVGDRRAEALALLNVAECHKILARVPEARSAADAALRTFQELRIPQLEAIGLAVVATVTLLEQGPVPAVSDMLARAAELARTSGARADLIDITCLEGHLALARGLAADEHLASARAIASALGLAAGSRPAGAIEMLARAADAARDGRELLGGMAAEDVPPLLAEWLRAPRGSSTGSGTDAGEGLRK